MSTNRTESRIPAYSSHRRLLIVAGALGGVLVIAACSALLVRASIVQSARKPTPVELPEGVGVEPNIGRAVPLDLVFRDSTGRDVELGELLRDKPVLVAPVYYRCPMLCNLVMDGLVRSLRSLEYDVGDQFDVVIVSFDPREQPELAAAAKETALKRYGREGTGDGWHFLTGTEPPIRELTDALGFHYQFDEQTNRYAHAAGLFLLTSDGRVARFFSGIEYSAGDVQTLIAADRGSNQPPAGVDFSERDLRLGIVESSESHLATGYDQVLLLCYHYDPASGKYGLAIVNVIRLAGGLTVAGMLLGFVWLLRFERRRAAENGVTQSLREDDGQGPSRCSPSPLSPLPRRGEGE